MSLNSGTPPRRIKRRLGSTPRARGSLDNGTCPDIFELSDGDIAVIGMDITDELDKALPPDAGRASYERIVAIPRETLLHAMRDFRSDAEIRELLALVCSLLLRLLRWCGTQAGFVLRTNEISRRGYEILLRAWHEGFSGLGGGSPVFAH